MNQRIEHLKDDEGKEILSHYRITQNKYGQPVSVPVIDVRDGITYRMLGMHTLASNNRSRYIQYNQYHTSRKQHKNI